MNKQDYKAKIDELIAATEAFKKSGRAGRVRGILDAKLLPVLKKVNEYVTDKPAQKGRKTRFKVVTKGDAKPKPQPKEEEQADPVERKILADSESRVKKPRKRKAKAQPKKEE